MNEIRTNKDFPKGTYQTKKSYMYTPFHGIGFMEGYFEARQKEIDDLLEGNMAAADNSGIFFEKMLTETYKGEAFDLYSQSSDTINSLHALLSLYFTIQNSETAPDEKIKWWIDRFVQRFEITKRIYDAYSKEWKKESDAYENVYVYVLLSLICLHMHEATLNYKYLNCTLKLNDHLVHLEVTNLTNEELGLISACLREEIRVIEKICRESEVIGHGA